MTRIIGGTARSRVIRTPSGDSTRPTADRVREALFSSLESLLGTLHGRAFLDVYAGSGAVGLEAASRGATRIVCVEQDRSVAALVAANARTLGLPGVEVVVAAASSLGGVGSRPAFEVVFLDPPYDLPNDELAATLDRLALDGWLAEEAVVVAERSRRTGAVRWPEGFEVLRDRRYGDTVLWYGRWKSPVGGAGRSVEES